MRLEELEKYRNNDGFIDFDHVLELIKEGKIHNINSGLDETRGSAEKFKKWFELEDCDILIRSTMFTGEIANYAEYAELIIEELAKQVDMPCAHYDLIKINGVNGNLSVNIVKDKEKQSLTALSQNQASADTIGGSTIDETVEKIKYFGNMQGIGKSNIKEIIRELFKLVIFDIFTMQTDRHLGNISLLFDGNKLKLSPIYDNECSLMLDKPKMYISEILESKNKEKRIEKCASSEESCIILSDKDRDENYVQCEDMLYFLTDNSQFVMDFAKKCSKKLDIEKAIQDVEKRINSEIPKEAKEFAIIGFNSRKKDIEHKLMLDMEIDSDMEGFDER